MADQKLEVQITGDARDFIKASKEAQTAVQDLGKSAEHTADSLKTSTASGVAAVTSEAGKLTPAIKQSASAFTEVRAAALTYFTSLATSPIALFAAGVIGVTKAMGELTEAERAAAGLMAAFSTESTNKGLERTRDLIDELASRSSFFDDDAISSGAVVLKNLGATQSQLEALLPVATNFAAIYGISVPQAAEKLAYGITGSTRSLRDFGILLRDNSTAAERYKAILERNAKAGDQLSTMSTGVTAAMGRMNKAIGDAWQGFGDNFQDFIIGMITGIQKLIQAISTIPTFIKLAADIAVNALGQIPIVIAGIGEGIKNLATGKGFSMKETKTFMDAFRAQMAETTGKDLERLKKQFADLFNFDGAAPGGGTAGIPDTRTGLIPEVKPGDKGPAGPRPKTLAEQAREMAGVKELYGFQPDVALGKSIAEVLNKAIGGTNMVQGTSAKELTAYLDRQGTIRTPEIQELIGMLAGLDMEPLKKEIQNLTGATLTNIQDPMEKLQAQINNLQAAMILTKGGLQPTAVTGQQKQEAQDLLAQQQSQMKDLQAQLANLQGQKNDQFISALQNAFAGFINSLSDTLGRAAAGGAGVSGGQMTRAVGGLAAGAMLAGAMVAPATGTLAMGGVTLPLAGVLQVGAMIVGGMAGFFGGMFDQQDETNQHLKELVAIGREQKTDALKRMGKLDEPTARLAKGLQPLADAGAAKGGKMASGTAAIIERFGTGSINDPQAREQLKTIAEGIATGNGDWVGMVNANMGLGIELNKENRQMLENLFLTMFNLVGQFMDDQTKRDEDARQNELKQLGSMPKNPVYVYDVTPADERFSFAPREAFFRASSTRQVGTNVTPAYQMG
jgi:hypothetical protein